MTDDAPERSRQAWPADLLPPPFADGAHPGLLDILPPLLPPAADTRRARGRDVVILVDGLGARLLREHRSLTPTLRSLAGSTEVVRTVFPSTTAAAVTSLMTGRAPLAHGTLGYAVTDPDTGLGLQQLNGLPVPPGPARTPDPATWMPLEDLGRASSRTTVHVGPLKHADSFLTRCVYRDWPFTGFRRAEDTVDAVRLAVRRAGQDGLVYLHLADVDHAGHVHGVDSDAWRDALAEADALIGTLLRRLPAGTRLTVTADHGMIDTDPAHRLDLADHPDIVRRIPRLAGESRALALQTDDDPAALAADLRDLLGERAHVVAGADVLDLGLLGPPGERPTARVAGRVPDLLVLARGRWAVDDFSRRGEGAPRMIGMHGSLTAAESLVPVVRAVAG